ncbi:MAG: clan AA aspartic protease [Gammaproteobacteria bacterium]|nr:clan AA aspartic protease [Gammaproteobacteria bacterium]
MNRSHLFAVFALLNSLAGAAAADGSEASLPLLEKDGETYYVEVQFGDTPPTAFLVDTGSGYLVINTATLAALKDNGEAEYIRDVSGTMANGSKTTVPIYRVKSVQIGCCCMAQDVEAAVFPGTRRQILGLSALKKLAPFALSFEPPRLTLSQCAVQAGETVDRVSENSTAVAAVQ